MAIYHFSVKIISRSTGRSSVAAAAYRSGEKLYNEREGIESDFTRKQGIEHSEIMLPESAPKVYQERETLWNAVEFSEKRKDAQTAREIEVALPMELNRQEQIELIREYTKANFTDRGMCADICIHDKGDGNPHAHIMLTTREVNPEGFAGKCREWNDKKFVEEWRKEWAVSCNREFEKKNLHERLDHRSFERQGKEQLPTIHLGASATAMEKRGQQTERGKYNEEVRATNMEYQNGLEELERQIAELKQVQQTETQLPDGREQPELPQQKLRFDEEETRSWQRGDGLMREDTDSAKYEALAGRIKQHTNLQDTQKQDTVNQDVKNQDTAEQTAERLNTLKADYVRLELQIQRTQQANGELQSSSRQLHGKVESIQEKTQTIDQYNKRIEQLKSDRAQLGMFSGKDKKAIDEQVKRLEQSKSQAENSLKRECGSDSPSSLMEKIQQKQDEIKGQLAALPDIGKLKEQQTAIEQTYKQERAAAMQRPDKDKIQAMTESRTQDIGTKTMNEKLAAAKAKSKLQEKDAAAKQQPTRENTGRER